MKELINKSIQRKVLLNPGPATTSVKVKQALIIEDICPREKEFGTLLVNVREKLKRVVLAGDDYESVLLGCSGTGAIESCLSSCVNEGESILIIENGAYGKRMQQICESLEINTEVHRLEWGEEINLKQLEEYLEINSKRFKAMAFVHHETTTGILNPIDKITDLAKKYDLVSVVDAMSSYAGIEINLSNLQVDYLISSSNKCIQGMAGLGFVIVKSLELKRISSFKNRSFYFNLYANFCSQKEKKQFLFTPPVQILYALDAALDEFFEEGGIRERSIRYVNLYEVMLNGMCDLGFRPLLETRNHAKILTTFYIPTGLDFDDMHDFLYQRNLTIYPGKVEGTKTFRISNIGNLIKDDIQNFLSEMKNYISQAGIKI